MLTQSMSRTLVASLRTRLLRPLVTLGVVLGACGAAFAQDVHPIPNPTPDQAADILSIINIWHAYASDVDSHNTDGVAALGTPTSGYDVEQDMDTLAPSACQPKPGAPNASTCVNSGGCVAMAGTGVISYLVGQNFYPPRPLGVPGHVLADPIVVLSPDSSTAKLYIYFSNGRYVNDFIRTQSGWKAQNIRITWPSSGTNPTAACESNWTPGVGMLQLLGDDLYYLHTLSGGPQLSPARAAEPALQRVETLVQAALAQVNALKYAAACPIMNQLISEVTNDATLDAGSKEYFQVIGTRFLQDDSCNGLTAPDRSQSNGGWASATYWRAYQLSGNANAIAIPSNIPAWSAAYVGSNQ